MLAPRNGEAEPASLERDVNERELRAYCQAVRSRCELSRGIRVAAARRQAVLQVIPEHVPHGIGDLARALQRARVEAVREDLSAEPVHLVEGPRNAHCEPLDAA